jgi:hypothetical protein
MFNSLESINTLNRTRRQLGEDAVERVEAIQMFERRMAAGRRKRLVSTFTRRANPLFSLAALCGNRGKPQYAGFQVIPLTRITGTENRSDEFDGDFYPLKEHLESRWVNVAIAKLRDIKLPPVELIQVGDDFFVRDGHHRISVARAFGQDAIDAEVTMWS